MNLEQNDTINHIKICMICNTYLKQEKTKQIILAFYLSTRLLIINYVVLLDNILKIFSKS